MRAPGRAPMPPPGHDTRRAARSRDLPHRRILNPPTEGLDCFERFIWHLNDCFPEDVVLGRGYF
jgi:hypothetical protein